MSVRLITALRSYFIIRFLCLDKKNDKNFPHNNHYAITPTS